MIPSYPQQGPGRRPVHSGRGFASTWSPPTRPAIPRSPPERGTIPTAVASRGRRSCPPKG